MTEETLRRSSPASWTDRLARRRLLGLLDNIEHGALNIVEEGHKHAFGTPAPGLSATITVQDPAFWGRAAFGGSVGTAEAFMDEMWECDDLVALVRIMVANRDLLDSMERGPARFAMPALKYFHWRNDNTRRGSRKNIAAHYDLGNDFFRLMLDPSLTYSSAYFADDPSRTLEAAQQAKLELICRKLDLTADDHLLEIGTGWGSMAIHAARHYGCRVTTTTISRQQHDYAARRIAQEGLDDRITLLQRDYRDLEGRFDKLVSVEMIEAVGANHLNAYTRTLGALLKRDGLALIQAITIEDQRYRQALHEVDFIKRFIFPGSFIPSVTSIVNSATDNSDLRMIALEDMGPSYARTLHQWRRNFHAERKAVAELGYDARFRRMWDFYLAYCEGGFLERSISSVQLLFAKPANRRRELGADMGTPS